MVLPLYFNPIPPFVDSKHALQERWVGKKFTGFQNPFIPFDWFGNK